MKKILFVGVFTDLNSTNISQSRGFKSNGCEVINYDYRDRLRKLSNINKRDDELINLVKKETPDLVLFSKCNMMHYRVIDECNKVSKTCLWYMDASNNFDTELIEKIKRVNICISGVEEIKNTMLGYNEKSVFLHQCPDELLNYKIENCNKTIDCLFIGSMNSTMHSDRKKYLDEVGFTYKNGVFGEEHNLLVNQTKVNLSFSPTDSSGVSVRLYKLMASGGFVLTTPWNGIEKTFTVGEHLDVFNSPKELKEKIDYYLVNGNLREKIARCGNKYVLNNFMPNKWASKILELI